MERRWRRRCLGQSLRRQRGGGGDRTVRRWWWRRRRLLLMTNQREWAVVMVQTSLFVMLMMHSRSRSGCRTRGATDWTFRPRNATSFDARRSRRRSRSGRRGRRRSHFFIHDVSRPRRLLLLMMNLMMMMMRQCWPCRTVRLPPDGRSRRRRRRRRWAGRRMGNQRTGFAAIIGRNGGGSSGVSVAVELRESSDFERLGDA